MSTTLTSKGQVTIPQHIREEMDLAPGAQLDFRVNDKGEVVLSKSGARAPRKADRFERVRGRLGKKWRTDELMALLRAE